MNTLIIDATITQDKPYCGMGWFSYEVITRVIQKKQDWHFVILLFHKVPSTLDSFLVQHPSNVTVFRIGPMLPSSINPFAFVLERFPASIVLKVKYPDAIWYSPFHAYGFFPRIFKTVYTQHDMALARLNVYSNKGKLIGLGRKLEYWFHLNRSRYVSRIWTITNTATDEYLKYYPENKDKIRMVTLACNEPDAPGSQHLKYLPQDWRDRQYLIYLGGGVQKTKNTHGIIRGYAEFLKILYKKNNISADQAPYLIIAGGNFTKGVAYDYLMSIIEEEGVVDNVIFTGYYANEDRSDLLRNAFGFIFLSLAEGFGIAPLEALSVGTPAILHNGTTLPEVVGDAALWVNGEDRNDVAEKIYKLFINSEIQKKYHKLGLERAKLFGWDKTASGAIKIFKEVFEEIDSK